MINSMQTALIKKDIINVTANKQLFISLLIVPLTMAVVLPSILILTLALTPLDSADMQELLAILPESMLGDDVQESLIRLMLDNVASMFFLMIPILTATVMAASSFVVIVFLAFIMIFIAMRFVYINLPLHACIFFE